MLAVVGVAVASAILAIHLGNLATAGRQIDTTRSELLPAEHALQLTEVATRDGYDNLLQALDSANSDTRGTFFAAAADSSKAQSNAWKQYLTVARASDDATRTLRHDFETALHRSAEAATTLIAINRTSDASGYREKFVAVRVENEHELAALEGLDTAMHAVMDATADRVAGDIGNSRRQLLVIFVIGMALFVVLAAFLLQAATAEERVARDDRRKRRRLPSAMPTSKRDFSVDWRCRSRSTACSESSGKHSKWLRRVKPSNS